MTAHQEGSIMTVPVQASAARMQLPFCREVIHLCALAFSCPVEGTKKSYVACVLEVGQCAGSSTQSLQH